MGYAVCICVAMPDNTSNMIPDNTCTSIELGSRQRLHIRLIRIIGLALWPAQVESKIRLAELEYDKEVYRGKASTCALAS